MKNKRVTPEQFAEFIAFKTGKNLTCPICGGLEHYLHDGYDTFSELCGEKIIGAPTIPYKIEPSPTEVMKFAAREFHAVHLNDRVFYQNILNEKAKTAILVTCSCCSNILFFDRERILDWVETEWKQENNQE